MNPLGIDSVGARWLNLMRNLSTRFSNQADFGRPDLEGEAAAVVIVAGHHQLWKARRPCLCPRPFAITVLNLRYLLWLD